MIEVGGQRSVSPAASHYWLPYKAGQTCILRRLKKPYFLFLFLPRIIIIIVSITTNKPDHYGARGR